MNSNSQRSINMSPLTSSSAARRNDEDQPREAPPPATPVKFHSSAPQGVSRASQAELDPNKILSNITRTGPTLKHIEAFNITLVNEVPLVILLPAGFLPPRSWVNDLNSTEASDFITTPPHARPLSNGASAPGREIFHSVTKELLYENGDAFRAARRQNPLPGHEPPRVLHARKFWNGLADVAEYWDTSLDNYIEGSDEHDKDAMDIDELRSEAKSADEKVNTDSEKAATENTAKKTMYTGRRRGAGHTMPNKYREDTVFAFVEMVVWPFHCRVEHAKNPPKLFVHDMVYPMEHLGSVYRTPKDARRARIGILEGPMMGVFCREQNRYRSHKQPVSEEKEGIMDLLKETGLMAMLAQRRAREGKKEVLPGAGKWWTTTPRWGGGRGGECGTIEEEAKEVPVTNQGSRKRSKKPTLAEMWQAMMPPKSEWENNVTYQHIGTYKPSVYDNIYLVSSVNHHISIVHLRIHEKYVEYISDRQGKTNNPTASQQPWYELKMQRSKWFDLLKADDRVEAMRGIWAVTSYLMRETTDTNDRDTGT